MSILGVIPARMASTRLPGKPLKDICGKTLIRRVWEQASASSLFNEVCIATDSPEIEEAGKAFGARVVMTSPTLATGSDRVAAVLSLFEKEGRSYDLIANVQGDMPFIKPSIIDAAVEGLKKSDASFGMSTIATPIAEEDEFNRAASVKVVLGSNSEAMYFSRSPIPHPRTAPEAGEPFGYKHIGLYVFRPHALKALAGFSQTIPEKREGLEQLRALSNGVKIKVVIIDRDRMEPSVEVDTPEDLAKAQHIASKL